MQALVIQNCTAVTYTDEKQMKRKGATRRRGRVGRRG